MKNLIFITDDWGYTKGGINTINVDLCKGIASLAENINVYCIVIYADSESIREAKNSNVNLVPLNKTQTQQNRFQENDLYKLFENIKSQCVFDSYETWIIGHDIITGDIAVKLCRFLQKKVSPNCMSAIIHHMDYEDYMFNKESYKSRNIVEQHELLRKPDILFGVGPRLRQSACNIRQSDKCPQINPGINFETEMIKEYYGDIKKLRAIVCGRIGRNDDIIKNATLAAKAFAVLAGSEERFYDSKISLIGCDEKQREELIILGSQYARRRVTINPYEFMDRSTLITQIAAHHICIMPSLKEGFGLTGWEAISLGVPVIISKASGLYEFLSDPEYIGYITAIDIKGGDENECEDIEELKMAILRIYNNYKGYKERALKLRQKLIHDGVLWSNAAKRFVEDLNSHYCDKHHNKFKKVLTHGLQPTIQFNSDVFTDRQSVVHDIFNMIEIGKQVINIYGKKGIGKSSVMKFLSDGINNILSKANSNKRHYFDNHLEIIDSLHVDYIELSSQTNLRKALSDHYSFDIDSLSAIVSMLKNAAYNRKLLLILDNINNESLFEEIMDFIEIASGMDFDYCIIIGSVKKCPLFKLSQNYHQALDIKPFDEKDIEQYAANNNIDADKSTIYSIKEMSKGLPIYIKLLLKQTVNYKGRREYADMERYIHLLLCEIRNTDKNKFDLIVYIALFSIIYDSNHGVPIAEIRKFVNVPNIDEVLDGIEDNFSLIEHHRGNSSARMHDIIRDSIIKNELSNNINKIREIITSFGEMEYQRKCFYILLLDKKYENTNEEDTEVINTIKEAVENENYFFLLSLGEHFLNIHYLGDYDINCCKDLYLAIIWGLIEAHIGVGNYPDAMAITRKCKTMPSIRSDNKSELHLKLLLTFANLKHLMNKYDEAIEDYNVILEAIDKYPNYDKYIAVCFWGMAHSQKHIGKNLKLAISNYNSAISHGEQNMLYKLKSERERVISYLAISHINEGKLLLDELSTKLNTFPNDEYMDIRIGVDRCQVLYEQLIDQLSEKSLAILEKARVTYKKIGKRLEYDTLFEIGEYYRKTGNYKKASQKYLAARELSIKNKDHNLETMCSLAMILCELLLGCNLSESKFADSHKQMLVDIISNCKTFRLYRNELFAQVMLDYLMKRSVEQETIEAFKVIDMEKEALLFSALNLRSLKAINFILM